MNTTDTKPTPAYTPDTQARFPERELDKLAKEYEATAALWTNNSRAMLAKKATAHAAMLRQAIDAQDALRQRFLESDANLRAARSRIATLEAELSASRAGKDADT